MRLPSFLGYLKVQVPSRDGLNQPAQIKYTKKLGENKIIFSLSVLIRSLNTHLHLL